MKVNLDISDICLAPWISLHRNEDGDFSACASLKKSSHYKSNRDLFSAYSSTDAGELRYGFLTNKTNPDCKACHNYNLIRKSEKNVLTEYGQKNGLKSTEQLAMIKNPVFLSLNFERTLDLANFKTIHEWLPEMHQLKISAKDAGNNSQIKLIIELLRAVKLRKDFQLIIHSDQFNFSKDAIEVLKSVPNLRLIVDFFALGNNDHVKRLTEMLIIRKHLNTNMVAVCELKVDAVNVFALSSVLEILKNHPLIEIEFKVLDPDSDLAVSNLPSELKSDIGHTIKFLNIEQQNVKNKKIVRELLDWLNFPSDQNKTLTDIKIMRNIFGPNKNIFYHSEILKSYLEKQC